MLIDELAEARVGDPEIEGEAAGAQMLGRHDCDPRGQPARKAKADAAELPEIMVGGEDQRAGLGAHTQRHAETAADMLLEPRRAGEAFGAVDHLRTPARAAIEAGPALTAARPVFAPRHRGGSGAARVVRQRRADQSGKAEGWGRGWQYGWVSVVDVTFTKKNTNPPKDLQT